MGNAECQTEPLGRREVGNRGWGMAMAGGHGRPPDLRAVLMEETAIAVSSPDSWMSGAPTAGSSFPASTSISSQKPDSSASSSTVPNLEMKSAEDFARHAAR